MNIEKYYKYTAVSALNASLISCIPIFLFTTMFIVSNSSISYFLLLVPFGLYSIICFSQFYLHKRRFENMDDFLSIGDVKSILKTNTVVLSFLPAPSLRMIVFDRDGQEVGEIKDEKFSVIRWYLPFLFDRIYPKSYGFYNTNAELQYIFTIKGNQIEIKNKEQKLISKIMEVRTEKKSISIFVYGDENSITMKKNFGHSDYQFEKKDGHVLAHIRKGWMPKEWSKRFKDPNFPLLTIDPHASDKEIIHLYALLTKLYAYTNH
ncbi:hypothetical protein [Niallia sp.]|uniref:hypothetical protein n=1 Tax=Niallia sp. TaxID=2837523 RepID=UPI00289F8AB3|nr:hypothetical protein [Niallia sp.]